MMQDGVTWLLNQPEQNLPTILADQGFDVWISNTRGTRFSNRHLSLQVNQQVSYSLSLSLNACMHAYIHLFFHSSLLSSNNAGILELVMGWTGEIRSSSSLWLCVQWNRTEDTLCRSFPGMIHILPWKEKYYSNILITIIPLAPIIILRESISTGYFDSYGSIIGRVAGGEDQICSLVEPCCLLEYRDINTWCCL